MSIQIGKYIIDHFPTLEDGIERIEIYHESGEGGTFKTEDFQQVVDKFYQDNF